MATNSLTLIQAIKTVNVDEVHNILKNGQVDPNTVVGYETPIIVAANVGNVKILKILKKHNCCLTTGDLLDYNWKRQPIHIAAGKGNLKFVKKLVQYGVAVDSGDQENRTPLHWAVTEGKDLVCKYLISVGANVNASQVDGITPLHAAVPSGRLSTCKLLIENGANVCLADRDGWTPFHTAVCYKYFEIVNLLNQSGSDVHRLTVDRENAVHIAACNDCPGMLQYLLDLGINADNANIHGQTPFYMAVSYNIFDNGLILLKSGASFLASHNINASPLKMAADRGYRKFIELMLNNGYDCSREKWIFERQFPIKIANDPEICERLISDSSTPRRLMFLTSLYLRQLFKGRMKEVESLQIPVTLKSYITDF